mmetsp:Transcript_16847/g.36243  ORF Transcript_16847/g.36243 Transcript_16847/m.36243 type:complete len:267 (+) Transcript_16847:406-1206(+)
MRLFLPATLTGSRPGLRCGRRATPRSLGGLAAQTPGRLGALTAQLPTQPLHPRSALNATVALRTETSARCRKIPLVEACWTTPRHTAAPPKVPRHIDSAAQPSQQRKPPATLPPWRLAVLRPPLSLAPASAGNPAAALAQTRWYVSFGQRQHRLTPLQTPPDADPGQFLLALHDRFHQNRRKQCHSQHHPHLEVARWHHHQDTKISQLLSPHRLGLLHTRRNPRCCLEGRLLLCPNPPTRQFLHWSGICSLRLRVDHQAACRTTTR